LTGQPDVSWGGTLVLSCLLGWPAALSADGWPVFVGLNSLLWEPAGWFLCVVIKEVA